MRKICAVLAALALAACGGGGGSNSGGGSATGLSVSFATSSLAFSYNEDEAPRSQVIRASASGTTDKDVLLGAEVQGNGISLPIQVAVDQSSRTASITVTPQPGLAPGVYSGTIKMLACADNACKVHHGGSPYSVPYTVTVNARLKASVASYGLAAAQSASTTANFTFTAQPGATVSSSIEYDGAQSGWLAAQVVGNTVQLQGSAVGLPAGTYQAYVVLNAQPGGQRVRVPVSLTVSEGVVSVEGVSLKVDSAVTVPNMQGTVPLSLAIGASAKTWSASSDRAWLKVSDASGTFPATLTWTIDPLQFAQLDNNAIYKANIRVATDTMLERTITFEVQKALAEIKGLDSVALLAGQSGDLMLYGNGFSRLNGTGNFLSISGAQPASVNILSDNVIRVSLPANSAGQYLVSLRHASGLYSPQKVVQVNASENFAYQTLNTEGRKTTLVWDSVSKSAFVVNSTMKSVMRYAAVNGTFQLANTRSFPAVDGIAMTPDRTSLVVQSNGNTIYKLSPTDLSTQQTLILSTGSGYSEEFNVPLPITGDNRLMHANYGWIDLENASATQITFESNTYTHGNLAQWAAISGNGFRAMRSASGRVTPSDPLHHLDLVDGKFKTYPGSNTPFFYEYAVDYAGNNWAFNGQVFDFDLRLKGSFKLPSGWMSNRQVFSRNGARLYLFAQSTAAGTKPRVYVFDTSQQLSTTTEFPVVGFIEFDDLPNCPYDPYAGYYAGCYAFNTQIALSDDEQTFFLAGDKKFVVLPIPSNLRSTTANKLAPMLKVKL